MFLKEAILEVMVKEHGSEVSVTKIGLALNALFAKVAKGDMGAIRTVFSRNEDT
nr:DUF5681 domain-containing protein [Oceanibium sediminis]